MTRPTEPHTRDPARPTDRSRHRRGRVRADRRARAERTHDVTLFESDDRLGGHAHTHDVRGRDGSLRIDSGFIVHNERTYPHLLRLFRELDVPTQPTEMSMSITLRGLRPVVCRRARAARASSPSRGALADPRFMRMLTEVPRFHRPRAPCSTDDVAGPDAGASSSPRGGFSDYFVRHFAIPLVACVWSCGDPDARSYPARHLFRFLDHHGMLTVTRLADLAHRHRRVGAPTSTGSSRACPTCAGERR